jgi:alanyl-tRNA synthetase
LELHAQFSSKIKDLKKTIMLEKKKFQRLKGNAAAQQRARKKKKERLEKENIVEIYDTPGRPSFLINEPNLLENMHNSIEFGAADHKRRKEVIKVRTIKHLREKMEEDYRIYMANSTMQNYLQPRHPNTKEAQRHHHPAQIRLAAVGRNEMNDHVDEHYCLASIKGVKSFASAFSQDVVLISQDDKAKVFIIFFLLLIDAI